MKYDTNQNKKWIQKKKNSIEIISFNKVSILNTDSMNLHAFVLGIYRTSFFVNFQKQQKEINFESLFKKLEF